MTKLIVGNWKMQKLFSEIAPFFEPFKDRNFKTSHRIGVASPSLYIQKCLEEKKGTDILIGSQNVSGHERGAFTGQIDASMLASMPVSFCLVGHSECRKDLKEPSSLIIEKAKKLQNNHILPILCVGETLDEKPFFEKVLMEQLKGIEDLDPKNLLIAYEPVWAIGTGVVAEKADIEKAHMFILSILKKHAPDFCKVSVLYGGSVNDKNAKSILELPSVGGLLIGGASLDPIGFKKLIENCG
jgi:triosephosphate isomerase